MNKYGPNSAQVEALLEKIKTITPEQAKALDAPWDAPWKAVWGAAWVAVREAALEAALVAVWDAVLVTVTKDLISEDDFNTLYGPWASVMEPQN